MGCGNSIIPSDGSVISIGDYAFDGCDSLTSITISDSVTSIGERAFYVCDSLTSITIPDGVKNIGEYAFDGCSNLTSVTFGDPNDWQGSHNGEVVGISGYDLSDPSTAASYLTSTYCRYYWKKG